MAKDSNKRCQGQENNVCLKNIKIMIVCSGNHGMNIGHFSCLDKKGNRSEISGLYG